MWLQVCSCLCHVTCVSCAATEEVLEQVKYPNGKVLINDLLMLMNPKYGAQLASDLLASYLLASYLLASYSCIIYNV